MIRRSSGLLLHVSSLPSRFGVGDLGPGAYAFLDYMTRAGQTLWQVLPLCPVGYGNSPYASPSTFAA
ncbi:MAG TPA: 4-alpha-glucanotransferase, partial [Rhodothermales bacterium]|nr:4-alpha-glucanotransferase [Rhodothermales bacterium]